MNRDEVWELIRNDDTTVYGEPIMDQFLRMTEDLERRHWDQLTPKQRRLMDPAIRLAHADTDKEREEMFGQAMKANANDLDEIFHKVAMQGSVKNCDWLIRKGATPNEGFTAAIKGGHLELCKYFEQFYADQGWGLDFCNALKLAAFWGRMEICQWAIDNGARCFDDALWNAAWKGRLEMMEWLLQRGAKDLDRALLAAARNGQVKACQRLIDKGAKNLDAALRDATNWGSKETQKFLIDKGAKPHIPEDRTKQ